MSKLKKLLPKRDLRARWLWVLALALTAVKLGLCSFQLIVASPDLSPIDDTLMFNLAKSISAGNWLGEYDWLHVGQAFVLCALAGVFEPAARQHRRRRSGVVRGELPGAAGGR